MINMSSDVSGAFGRLVYRVGLLNSGPQITFWPGLFPSQKSKIVLFACLLDRSFILYSFTMILMQVLITALLHITSYATTI